MAVITNVDISLNIKQILYGILRLLSGITSNTYSAAFVLGSFVFLFILNKTSSYSCTFEKAIELTGSSYRIKAANSMYYFYILGEYITVLMCYFIRDYNWLYLFASGFMCIFPIYFWIIPESPRWLMTQGKYEEASRVLKRIADSNKKQLPDEYNFGVLQDDLQGEDTDRMINDSEEPHVSKPYEPIKFVDLSRVVLTSHIDQL
jgi:hypothetical protein